MILSDFNLERFIEKTPVTAVISLFRTIGLLEKHEASYLYALDREDFVEEILALAGSYDTKH
ncbi:MAG TPA: hypothetical protein PKH33_04275 [bacterium]|nr:hypothetical protein [bacterium]